MKQKKILSWIMLLVLALTVSLGAFAQEGEQKALDQRSDEEVVAKAFGEDVLYKEAKPFYSQLIYIYGTQYGMSLSNEDLNMLEQQAVRMAVSNRALEKIGEEKGIYPLADEKVNEIKETVQTSYNEAIEQYTQMILGEKENPTEEEKAQARNQAIVTLTGNETVTEEAFLAETIDSYLFSELYSTVYDELTKDVQVSDEELKSAFDQMVESQKGEYENSIYNYEIAQYSGTVPYYRPAGYRGVGHILLEVDEGLLKTYQELQARLEEQNNTAEIAADAGETQAPAQEDEVTPEQIEEARQAILSSVQATVDEIMGKFEGGESFASLVEAYGTDPGMTVEPNKTEGYAVNIESILLDSAFVAGSFSDKMQKPGDVSDPVVSSFGVHILHYVKDLAEGSVEYTDTVKESLRESVLSTKQGEVFNALVQEKIDSGTVEYLITGPATQEEAADTSEDSPQAEEEETPAEETQEGEGPEEPAPQP